MRFIHMKPWLHLRVLLTQFDRFFGIAFQIDAVELRDIPQAKHFARDLPHRRVGVEGKFHSDHGFGTAIGLYLIELHCGKN